MEVAPVACLIDDNALVREALAFSLRDHGFEVEEAGDGTSGLSLALSAEFDVIITDLEMPGMHGLSLIQELRGARPGLAIVAISGGVLHGTSAMQAALAQGADVCLAKPMRPSELLRVVKAAIERRKATS